MLIRVENGEVTGINRNGLTVALPAPIEEAVLQIGRACIVDGEAVGDRLFVFELLMLNGMSMREVPYGMRLEGLSVLIGAGRNAMEVVQTAKSESEKQALLSRMKAEKAEGVVFKRHDAEYEVGRPASGGPQLKFKFYATLSCIVAVGRTNKRSVGLQLLDGAARVNVGNVTIPPKVKMPLPEAVVEIRYLYAYPGGSLYQPTYLGARHDIARTDCTLSQLKFKQSDTDEDA